METPPLADRTVLVTGGAGFVGSHLVDALAPHNEVRVLDNLTTGSRSHVHDDARLIEGNVRDPIALQRACDGVDVVFHEAAVVSVTRSVDRPRETNRTNLEASLLLLEQARQEDARVVLASSAAVYGDPTDVPVSETARTEPTSPYGVQKLALDQYARVYASLYGLETVALRYFNVYGPRQQGPYSGVISAFLEQAQAGEPITVEGDGEQTRDFVHVEDVVRANLAAATTDRTGEAYNVGTGSQTSVLELAETVKSAVDTDAPIVHRPPRQGDIRHSRADVSKARSRLEFEARIDLEAGIQDLAERTAAPERPRKATDRGERTTS
ncbi:NAD-dependent epimerase/dehydratase family protein [Natrononativus amylolyticus]|uniref:NAD-dependent epimerase/dehydratase family protein n=1 Tax=Natrononativus amylolyticus TaxID=2963434 RepID=UPI0020CF007E|nr:NAD-dependent epimerase/dehydratase family protein [Natrononativus amylolyticus]